MGKIANRGKNVKYDLIRADDRQWSAVDLNELIRIIFLNLVEYSGIKTVWDNPNHFANPDYRLPRGNALLYEKTYRYSAPEEGTGLHTSKEFDFPILPGVNRISVTPGGSDAFDIDIPPDAIALKFIIYNTMGIAFNGMHTLIVMLSDGNRYNTVFFTGASFGTIDFYGNIVVPENQIFIPYEKISLDKINQLVAKQNELVSNVRSLFTTVNMSDIDTYALDDLFNAEKMNDIVNNLNAVSLCFDSVNNWWDSNDKCIRSCQVGCQAPCQTATQVSNCGCGGCRMKGLVFDVIWGNK